MAKTIEVVVSPKGETVVRTVGYAGPACREATRALEAALGIRTGETLTGEFHQAAGIGQAAEQRSQA